MSAASTTAPRIVVPTRWDRSSPDDWEIHDPLGKLIDKYFDGGTVLTLEFDLYAARRASDPGWHGRLDAADLAVTMLMNSRYEWWDVDPVFANRAEIDGGLRRLPTDLELADADLSDPGLRDPLLAVFRGFRVHKVSVAKAAKVLCLKRPRLIPMLDSLVRMWLYDDDQSPTPPADPDEFAALCVSEMELVQRLLRWPVGGGKTNQDGAKELAEAMVAEAERRGLTDGVPPGQPWVTAVRVLESLIWFDKRGYKQFGYTSDEPNARVHHPDRG
jgi:hypothetical protein